MLCTLSTNTGCFYEEVRDFSDPAVGWDGIINQLVSSATETENTNDMLMGTSAAHYHLQLLLLLYCRF
jgi:hypothetical protein